MLFGCPLIEGQYYNEGHDHHDLKKRDTDYELDEFLENLGNETSGGIRCPVGTEFCTSVGACSENCDEPTGMVTVLEHDL